MKTRIIPLFLFGSIILSFIGGYMESFNRSIYHSTSLSISFFSILVAINFLMNRKNLVIGKYFFFLVTLLLFLIFYGLSIHQQINLYPIFLLTLISTFYLLNNSIIESTLLLRITNVTFLIYLFCSLLLYFKIIPQHENLNIFDFYIEGLQIKTFIGLYGGTASIDSYAMIVGLLNLLFGRGRKKYSMAVLAIASSVATLRFTPYLIIILPLFFLKITRKLPVIFQRIVLILFFISFLFPLLIETLFDNYLVNLFINRALNGRAFLWMDFVELYNNSSLQYKLFGFGGLDDFVVSTWNFETNNPHNIFLAILINYGIIIYLVLITIVVLRFPKLSYNNKFVILAIFSAGIGNSVIIGFQFYVLSLWLLWCFTDNEKITISREFIESGRTSNSINKNITHVLD